MRDDPAPTRATRRTRPGAAARGTREKAGPPRAAGGRLPKPAAVAKIAARAEAIRTQAGSKLTGAMRELVYAAAGLTGFAVETARDVVQFLVRRGQMAQDEGERLLREAEVASKRRVAAGRVPQPVVAAVPDEVAPAVPAKRVRKRAAKRAAAPEEHAVESTPAEAAGDASRAPQVGVKRAAKRAAKRADARVPAKAAAGKRAGRGGVSTDGSDGRVRGGAKSGAKKRAD